MSHSQFDGEEPVSMRGAFFGWRGRLGRKAYGLGWLFWLALLSAIFSGLSNQSADSAALALFAIAFLVATLFFLWSIIALSVKRLRDLDLPPALIICLFIPAVSFFALIVLLVWPSRRPPHKG